MKKYVFAFLLLIIGPTGHEPPLYFYKRTESHTWEMMLIYTILLLLGTALRIGR